MHHRIRVIIGLLAACLLGINGFQAYWLYHTYQLTTAQFNRTAHEALVAAVQQQLIAGVEALRAQGVELIITGTGHPAVGPRREVANAHVAVVPPGGSRDKALPLRQPSAHIVIDDWSRGERLSLAVLTRAYHRQLLRRGVDSAAVLDTFSLRAARGGPPAGQLPPRRGRLARFSRPTPPVLLSPKKELYVRAYLLPPTQYLWQRLGGLLGGSVLLLVFTSGCFVLVLHTIVAQRKLAEARNEFINNMTHELKTPLTTVSAAVETLERFGPQADPQKQQQYLHIARTELRRLSDLVDKVLTLASKERQALVLHPEPVYPAELVGAAVQRHQLHARKPVRFEVDVDPTDVVQADRLHLDGVLNNLLDNAIKYSNAQVTIALRSQRTAGGWQLTVQDDGVGIAGSYQAAVFDRFFRVPTGNLHPVKGFGLGLYYVRQVVERHGGRIAVRSELGQGSAFTLWLPLGNALPASATF